jgi:hypothetical protein
VKTIPIRISRWQTRTPDELGQELAREIERQEAPLIALWRKRVKENVKRRETKPRLAAVARFCEPVRLLRRQAF